VFRMAAPKRPGITQFVHREDTFLVDYAHRQKPYTMSVDHMHDSYEIYYLFSGQRKYFIRDRVYLIEKGDLVFIPKYDLHRTLNGGTPTHERMVLNFKESFLESFFGKNTDLNLLSPFGKEIPTLKLNAEDRLFIEGLLHRMTKELKEQSPGYVVYLKALTIELLLFLMRSIDKYEMSVSTFDSPLHQKISEIANYIHDHYMQPLTLAHLSRQFYISTYYLCRVFKEISGFSFVEYLNHVRIKEAQRLLRETELKILHVSEQVGFESIAHFGRVFKHTAGLSPTRYRRVHQNAGR
jgi:AraC-like DNA-binding protein